jgi:tetratricopeptide (TPR) repeat protein
MSNDAHDSKPKRPRVSPTAGRSGSARSIGEELGELDFEPDALLDSLLIDDLEKRPSESPAASEPATTVRQAPAPEPDQGSPADEQRITISPVRSVGPSRSEEPETATPHMPVTRPLPSRAKPRVGPPRPDSHAATAVPPSVNPAGLPPREPFGTARTPTAGRAAIPPAAPSPAPRSSLPSDFPPEQQAGEETANESAFESIPPDEIAFESVPPTSTDDIDSLLPDEFSLDSVAPDEDVEALLRDVEQYGGSEAPDEDRPTRRPPPDAFAAESIAPESMAPESGAAEHDVAPRSAAPSAPRASTPSKPWQPSLIPGERSPWQDERPAAQHLNESPGVTEQWTARAAFMEREAAALGDPAARARAFTVVSELWAIAGEFERARQAADQACAATSTVPLASRQQRWLAAAQGDWKTVTASLEFETRTSPTPEARAHAAYLGADLHRVTLGDEANSRRRLDLAGRVLPSDPRAPLLKLTAQLGRAPQAPRVKLPDEPVYSALAEAVARLAPLRGAPCSRELGPLFAIEDARRALRSGDRAHAGEAVRSLSTVPGLERAARWLSAALFAPISETRGQAIAVLTELLELEASPGVNWALAARAVEQGDAEAIRRILSNAATEGGAPFGAVDAVALGALSGIGGEELLMMTLELEDRDELRPLLAAATSIALPPGAPLRLGAGNPASQGQVRVGRALGRFASHGDEEGKRSLMEALSAEQNALDPVVALVSLELGDEDQRTKLIALFSRWASLRQEPDRPDGHVAAALVAEVAGLRDVARREYAASHVLYAASETTARALADMNDEPQASQLLSELADVTDNSMTRATLLIEAALRIASISPTRAEDLLEQAVLIEPALSLAAHLGEHLARQRGDSDQLIKFLRARRETTTTSAERSLDLVREALLVADSDATLAASLLAEALAARPSDIALSELHERLLDQDDDRGRWRERCAGESTGATRARLLLEASFEYERAGDTEGARRTVLAAIENESSPLAEVTAERLLGSTEHVSAVAERLEWQLGEASDPMRQRELCERLAALAEARGERERWLGWLGAILEQAPDDLATMRKLEHAYFEHGDDEALERVVTSLARLPDAAESEAHALMALRLRVRRGAWEQARELVEPIAERSPAPLWALRELSVRAAAMGDARVALVTYRALAESSRNPLDVATLCLRAAEAAERVGDPTQTIELLGMALEAVPDHFVALTLLARVLESTEDHAGAAEALERVARASAVEAHQAASFYRAGVLWAERVENPDRALSAFEETAARDLEHEDVLERLQALCVERGDRSRLAEILERKLARTDDREERVAIEVMRGRALAEVGERSLAKQALAAALDASPDHAEALDAFAELCLDEGDFTGAEQAWIRLARHVADPERQAQIYVKLGRLYDEALPNPERAELAYKEVLKRRPDDPEASARLVDVYGRLGQAERAVELQLERVARAQTVSEKRTLTLELARTYEQVAGDPGKAAEVLDRARRSWGQDGAVLAAAVDFHRRRGDERAVGMLLLRASADARRALGTGRFEPGLFELLATAASLRGDAETAAVVQATLGALKGEPSAMTGGGPSAGDPVLDDLLAPEGIPQSLRALTREVGHVLDAAYPLNLKALRAKPLAAERGDLSNLVAQVAASLKLREVEVLISPALGPVCVPVSSSPPVILYGQALLDSSDDVGRYFLLIRALKLMQIGGATLSRTAPVDLWPLLSGLLSLFAPDWRPQGVEPDKLAQAQQKIRLALIAEPARDVPALAIEVIGAIGNRASQMGTLYNQWADRAALLAVGDPSVALRGVALAGGHGAGPPEELGERLRWILRNAEARDLMIYSTSEEYGRARKELGLSG